MIVKMNKVTILCTSGSRNEALNALRDLGVVHVHHVHMPAGVDLDKSRERLAHVRRALEVLPKGHVSAQPSGRPADDVVNDLWSLIHRKADETTRIEELTHEIQRIEPYGSFDPASIRALAENGIRVRLYQITRGAEPVVPEGAVLTVLGEDKASRYVAVTQANGVGQDIAWANASELRLPEKSLDVLRGELAGAEQRLAEVEKGFLTHAGDYGVVAEIVREAEESVHYLEVSAGMGSSAPVDYLCGFCPVEKVDVLRTAAEEYGWGLIVEEPSGDDKTPTLIRNPAWIRPIKAVFDFIGVLPGYEEIDISAVFLFFLSLFFAMLVGDAGYGLIFLALTAWGRRKFPKAPAYPFHLMYIMSGCTVLWGVITGSWFGAERLPALLDGFTVAWLKEPKNVMLLCFVIGAVHLTIAHLWNIVRGWNSLKSLAQFGWILSTWTMFFMARNLVLGHPLPGWIGGMFVVGVVLIILFMTAPRDFKNEWFNHVMLPLNLVSNFVDVVSYIRLFAVGTAGYAVASSFNKMILGGGVDGVVAGLVAALLLFLGHTLNILLCVMGVLVHGVRLNTLEFSSHIGMAWTGTLFKPFARLKTEE